MAGVIEYATKLSQLIAQQNKAMNTRNLSTLKQRQNILKTTNMLAETINIQQSKTIKYYCRPKMSHFQTKRRNHSRMDQNIKERATIIQLPEPNKNSYTQTGQCQHRKANLHTITELTIWTEFTTLIITKCEPIHITHDLIQRLRSTRMHKHNLHNYINAFERHKRLI